MGNIRHIELNQLWLHDKVNNVEFKKVRCDDKSIDALTKYVDQMARQTHMEMSREKANGGRHELAYDARKQHWTN